MAAATTAKPRCFYTARAEIAVGVTLFFIGAFMLMGGRRETWRALSFLGLIEGIFAILLPTVLIGICMKNTMTCRQEMEPTLYAAGGVVIVLSLVALIINEMRGRNAGGGMARPSDAIQAPPPPRATRDIRQRFPQLADRLLRAGDRRVRAVDRARDAGRPSSLDLTLTRLGADILVVPQGAEEQTQGALLMGQPVKTYLPLSKVGEVAGVPGVEKASPQLYLESLSDAPCCSVANMFMVAYDPATDFTLGPWLTQQVGRELTLGEAVGGKYVFVPEGEENIELYGYILSLEGNLAATGTNLDNSIFITFDTRARNGAPLRAQRRPALGDPRRHCLLHPGEGGPG